MPDPPRLAKAYPHELSGGQRQRVMIAMALALEPKLLIADEPTTALDVTTQAQILKLIDNLRDKHGTAVLFITHDMGVVAEIADRIAVLEKGVLVEEGHGRSGARAPPPSLYAEAARRRTLADRRRSALPCPTVRRCSASKDSARSIASAASSASPARCRRPMASPSAEARRDARPRRRIRFRQVDRRALLPAG